MGRGYATATVDLGSAIAVLRKNASAIVLCGLLGLMLGVAAHFLLPRQYVANASFVPVATGSMSQFADPLRGLAMGAGIASSIIGGPATASEIYPDIMRSSQLLGQALGQPPLGRTTRYGRSFVQALGFRGVDSTKSMARAIRYLRAELDVRLNRADGVIEVRFAHSDPALASALLSALLDCLNRFNTDVRQSQAGNVRRFLEKRLEGARRELGEAESSLVAFKLRNVRYVNSPRLELEEERLQRDVRLAESIYQTITQQFEMARIDEARDTPSLTMIEPVQHPVIPSGPGPVAKALLGAVLGLFIGTAWIARSAVRLY